MNSITHGKRYRKTKEEVEQLSIWQYKKTLNNIKASKDRNSKQYDLEAITEEMAWHIKQTHTNDDDIVIVAKYSPQFVLNNDKDSKDNTPKDMISQCAFPLEAITPYKLKRLITFGQHVNLYATNNNLCTNYRRITELVKSADCLALDIDYYNIPHLKDLPAETVYSMIIDNVFKPLGILPSYGIDSGKGLYIFFLIEHLPLAESNKDNRYIYSKVLSALIDLTKDYGADPKCKDFSRVLRLPQTVNQKTNRLTKIIDFDTLKLTEPKRIDVKDLFKLLLPNELVTATAKQSKPKAPRARNYHPTTTKPRKMATMSLNSLGQARAKDLISLIHLRKGELEGKRNTLLFILSLSVLEYLFDVPDMAKERVYDANDLFTEPLKDNEVEVLFNSAYNSAERRQTGQKGAYCYSNERIIKELEITAAESCNMITLISTVIKYERNNKRRRDNRRNCEGLTAREQSKADNISRITEYLKEGMSYADIANQLHISMRTVYRCAAIL